MKHHEAAVLLVGLRVFLVRRMIANEIHESQRMVGVRHGPLKVLQGHPANAAMVKLNELAVRLQALFFVQDEPVALPALFLGLEEEITEISGESVWPSAVRPVV